MYLEQRRRLWYAVHDVPRTVIPKLINPKTGSPRKRFVQCLGTSDKKEALRRAGIFESRWRSEIAIAEQGSKLDRDAEFWAQAYRTAPEDQQPVVHEMIADAAEEMRQVAAIKAGILSENEPGYRGLPVHKEADKFLAIATGVSVAFDRYLDEYLSTLKNEPKSIFMKRSSISRFAVDFSYTSDIQRKAVQRWADSEIKAGKAVATVQRSLSELRGYWKYLQSVEAVSEDAAPFDKITLPKTGKNIVERRKPFTPSEVVKLRNAADDPVLADLIGVAMFTGCRIEEICSLPVSRCYVAEDKPTEAYVDIEDAKTEAGWRRIPIHSELLPTIARLIGDRSDGFLFEGLEKNKYGDRAGVMSKRFARLRSDMGFGPAYVFHSIRKTVATMFENAGVPESVAAGILGHDHPTMTFGLYSGGAGMDVKREAIGKLAYTSNTVLRHGANQAVTPGQLRA